ncbi:unnamed protein product, partial [Amoebophrya sp. A25]|eukprot:GSA25T00002660001.1
MSASNTEYENRKVSSSSTTNIDDDDFFFEVRMGKRSRQRTVTLGYGRNGLQISCNEKRLVVTEWDDDGNVL